MITYKFAEGRGKPRKIVVEGLDLHQFEVIRGMILELNADSEILVSYKDCTYTL
jgi:hypothetical protein